MSNAAFRSEFDENGYVFLRLVRTTKPKLPFGKSREDAIAFDDWTVHAPPATLGALGRVLQAWSDNETEIDGLPVVEPTDLSARLGPSLIVALADADARSLGLPPVPRLSLNLQARDHIASDKFQIGVAWTRTNGQRVQPSVVGARVRLDGAEWRLVEPMASVLRLAGQINAATDAATRQASLAMLRSVLPNEHQELVQADGYIESLRLSYAAAFSLSLTATPTGFDVDPVLFARQAAVASSDEGVVLDEAADGLLPPNLQADFVDKFRSAGDRAAYLLKDGSIVFVDPSLRQALKVVSAVQRGSIEDRNRLVRSPHRVIRDALAESGILQAEAIESLFVETQQFSERVLGVDVWRKPVLPWIKPKPNTWLPESFGIRIGDGDKAQILPISASDVPEVAARLDEALKAGAPTLEWNGTTIPATEQTREALSALQGLATGINLDPNGTGKPPTAILNRFFLQVRDNLADLEYAPLFRDVQPFIAEPAQLPALRSRLKPHQVAGFQWLVSAWRASMPGVVLADDMGLGKTLQALAFLMWLREQDPAPRPVLVVAPTGLLANWRAEIEMHLPPAGLGRIVRAYSNELRPDGGRGKDIGVGTPQLDPSAWTDAGVVLTTFETMRDYHMSFARIPFSAIVFDEVQKLKNPASQMTRAAKTLNARFQIAMTGTPVENRLQDLWSIVDVVHPGLLGSSREFEGRYPASDATKLQALNDFLTQSTESRPATLLRRMKADHLPGLPKKSVITIPLPMPIAQASVYMAAVGRAVALKGSGRGYMLEVLQRLRSVSLHPKDPTDIGSDADAYLTESARLQGMFDVLNRVRAANEKVLIFCESLSMQSLLAVQIKRRFGLRHDIARIHGGVTGDARQLAVDMFQKRPPGFDVMILSPKAGGVGLTLTAANHVIHLSRWWNPAVEDQATDRVYRIGQKLDVSVYLPQAVHPDPALGPSSFDLKLDALMRRKRDLSGGVLMPPDDEADAEALFNSVVGEDQIAEAPKQQSASTIETSKSGAASINENFRPDEQRVQHNQPPAISLAQTSLARKVYGQGAARDFNIIEDVVRGEEIVTLLVRDPYVCASNLHRAYLIDFIKLFQSVAKNIEAVSITAYDGESLDRARPESSAQVIRDLENRWRQRFPVELRLKTLLVSRRQVRGFHDRRIEAVTRNGRRIVWDLTNGVDGLMNQGKECTVVREVSTV